MVDSLDEFSDELAQLVDGEVGRSETLAQGGRLGLAAGDLQQMAVVAAQVDDAAVRPQQRKQQIAQPQSVDHVRVHRPDGRSKAPRKD